MSIQPSMMMIRIGGQDYPMRSEPNCKTCMSPHRQHIENELLKARSYAVIAKSLIGLPEGVKGHPTSVGIAKHVKAGHLPLGTSTQRRLTERRAQEIGRSIENDEDTLADHITVSQMIVQRGVEMVAEGTLEIKGNDVMAAARFLQQVEQESGGETDSDVWINTVMEHMSLVMKHMPAENQAAYARDLTASPVLRALKAKMQTVQGEVTSG